MLQEFTWQQFLVAAMVLSLLWYAGLWFFVLRHRAKTADVDNGTKSERHSQRLPHHWEHKVEDISDGADLMGKPKLPEGMSLMQSSDVQFAADKHKADQVGLIPDLLEELKSIFRQMAEEDGNKGDFLKLLDKLKIDFPKMDGHPQLHAVNEFIIDHAPFHLTKEELENLWD